MRRGCPDGLSSLRREVSDVSVRAPQLALKLAAGVDQFLLFWRLVGIVLPPPRWSLP
jgi:hypothetical protein